MTTITTVTGDVLTIGLTLVGFLVGLLLASLYAGVRSRSLREAHIARVNGLLADMATRDREAAELREELDLRVRAVGASAAEARALQTELRIERAQLAELQSEMGAIEDRLNAAEARAISVDAELADRLREIREWTRAYNLLRANHDAIILEHADTEDRRRHLEEDLQAQQLELADLGARLEALQSATALQAIQEGTEPSTLQQRVAAISLLKATAEAGLRRRELELAEVRSQLSAMRYSINVLTASAAELATRAAASLFGVEEETSHTETAQEEEPISRPAVRLRPVPSGMDAREPAQQTEALASLEGMIADWFAEIKSGLPYPPSVLRAFAGTPITTSDALSLAAPSPHHNDQPNGNGEQNEDSEQNGDGEQNENGEQAGSSQPARKALATPDLPPALMLATIKAAATTSLERSVNRQYELARSLTETQAEFDELVTRIQAWRSMLYVTLQNDADLLHLLEKHNEAQEGNPAALLSACATVALTAYQNSQEMLRRLERRQNLLVSSAPAPEHAATAPRDRAGMAPTTPAAHFRQAMQ